MSELSVEIRANEIHEKANTYFKTSEKFAYKFLMELKVMRDEKLYKELGFEDFEEYTLTNFGYSRNTVNERIQDATNWGEEYNRALGSYGKTKTRHLGLMPLEEREDAIEEGIPTEDGIKPIDEATTREIAEYQKQLKQKDRQVEQAKESERIALKQLEEAQNKEPETITKTEYKIPPEYEGYKSNYEQVSQSLKESQREVERLTKSNDAMQGEYNRLVNERKDVDEKSKKYDELTQAIQEMEGRMNEGQKRIKAQKEIYDLVEKTDELIVEVAPLTYLIDAEDVLGNEYAQRPIRKIIDNFREMADRLERTTEQPIIEGKIING